VCRQAKFSRHRSIRRQPGFTLVELSLVVLILGIMAAAVIPAIMSADSGKLHVTAEEIAGAMRFARSEAMRLRQPHGFRFGVSSKRLRVFSVDVNTAPWAKIFDIYHPVSKKLYDIDLDEQSFAAVDSISAVREFRGTCNQLAIVYFDANGIPRCFNPATILLDRYEINLKTGDFQRVVSVEAITGRVTVQ
jgi:type II secretion system protein H